MIVKNKEQYRNMIDFIESHNHLAFDVETTGLDVHLDKVIGFGVSNHNDIGYYLPLLVWDEENSELIDPFGFDPIPILKLLTQKRLIMWNGSFDIRITKNNLGIDLLPALFAEGMLMKHTLIEDGRFGLKDTAIEFSKQIGFDAEIVANKEQMELKNNLESKGASNSEFYKADLVILGTYCISDCTLTFKLFRYFHIRLEEEGLVDFFFKEEVMPLYKLVTIPLESNGVKMDMKLLNKYNNEILIDIEDHKNQITESLLSLPETQLLIDSIAIKKYPQKRTGVFAQKTAEVFKLNLPKTKSGKFLITEKNLKDLPESKARDFLLGGIDMPYRKSTKISRAIYEEKCDEPFNINSKSQMKLLVFDIMGLKPLSTTAKGQPQFNADFIEHISDKYEWASKLNIYNKLCKIQSSYFQRFLDRNKNGYYYFNYKQHGTISGRYSADAQQLNRPKEKGELPDLVLRYNNIIRSMFIAKDGMIFLDADYNSLEPHVFSHVTNDEGLLNIFRNGHDFYSTIAIATEKLEGYSPDKKADNYLGKLNKPLRQSAKAYSLGIPYGLSAYALGKTLNIPTKEAQLLVDGYLNGFPNLKKWMEDSEHMAKTKGYVKTETGRIRHLPRVKEIYEKYGDRLNDWRQRKIIESKIGRDEFRNIILDWKNGLNNAKNVQIQGLSASIINRAMIAMTREFSEKNLNAYIVATIHDQAIVECDYSVREEVYDIMERCLQDTYKLKLDLIAKPEYCYNWNEGH